MEKKQNKRKLKSTEETSHTTIKKKKASTKTETHSDDDEVDYLKPSGLKKSQNTYDDLQFTPQWQDYELLADNLSLNTQVANNVVTLFENGNEIPFIARYRQDKTENMTPDQLRTAKECFEDIKHLKNKIQTVLKALNKSKVLNEFLLQKIRFCRDVEELEHIYAPYKPNAKKSLAEQAKILGLDKPAMDLMQSNVSLDLSKYVNSSKKGIQTEADVEKGIMHIIASVIATNTDVLNYLRKIKPDVNFVIETKKTTKTEKSSDAKNVDDSKFADYFNFKSPVRFIKPHQVLAINRGESQKILCVKVDIPNFLFDKFSKFCQRTFLSNSKPNSQRESIVNAAIKDAYTRLIQPLITRQIRAELKLKAEKASHEVFATNLKQLLLTPPIKREKILGIDPGFTHGCKMALVSETGSVLAHTVIYPHKNKTKALDVLKELLQKHQCSLIALGNGKGCRFTEEWLSEAIQKNHFAPLDVSYTIVAEEGASIYSCSVEAKKEFGDLDPTVIGAISLARRLQDPLAELVKVEPQHLGVGMYQHDMKKKQLETLLDEVVSECVSFVGVDLNTASQCLLRKIAGLADKRATLIIEYREKNGPFINRKDLLKVKGIGPNIFEQCAGFLRVGPINDAEAVHFYKKKDTCKLDRTDIHPESYEVTKKLIKSLSLKVVDVGSENFIEKIKKTSSVINKEEMATQLNTSTTTLNFILETLSKSLNHDLRTTHTHAPLFKKGLVDINELNSGMVLTGRVNNVTHFGCFVDIGVGCNGLIHSSKMNKLNLQIGDRVEVKVLTIEMERKRIGLEAVKKL